MNIYSKRICIRTSILAMQASCGEDAGIAQLFINELCYQRMS